MTDTADLERRLTDDKLWASYLSAHEMRKYRHEAADALAAQRAEIERLQETIRYERDRNLDKVLDARDEVAVLRRALQELLHEIIEPASGHHAPLNDAIASARAALGARK